jgi:tetraacyldisaccharide 4'-kinase
MSQTILNFWYRSPDKIPTYGWLLWPLEFLYKKIYFNKQKQGLRRRPKVQVPVIVVGNLTVGGTGKTPLVIALVEYFKQEGYSPGVLTRGYKAQKKNKKPYLISEQSDITQTGDEALLIYQRTRVPVVVCPDRLSSMNFLIDHLGCDLIISDDGLQHHCLPRTIEIVVFDGERGFGNQRCLPFGPLREPLNRLEHVDYIIENTLGGNGKITAINKKNNVFKMYLEMQGVLKNIELSLLQSKPCYAITGIGHPERFFNQLRNMGLSIKTQAHSDHHDFSVKDFCHIPKEAWIIITEKDAVKCLNFIDERFMVSRVSASLDSEFFTLLRNKLENNQKQV